MLKGVSVMALGVVLGMAGCLGGGAGDADATFAPDACLLGGPPRDAPQHRAVFNVTDEHVERFPVLASLFDEPGTVVPIDCTEGQALFEHLDGEGADAVILDEPTGHNVYLHHAGTTIHVTLRARV